LNFFDRLGDLRCDIRLFKKSIDYSISLCIAIKITYILKNKEIFDDYFTFIIANDGTMSK